MLFGQVPPAPAGDLVTNLRARWQNHKGVPSAEALAVEIQKLEKHIDWFGTIVAKQPDVWGQARLMKHRSEFEKHLEQELGNFSEKLQGSISRSDQAFLASAFSLSAAASGSPAVQLPQTAATSNLIATRQRAALKAAGVANPTPDQLTSVTAPTAIQPPSTNDAAGLIDGFDTEKVIQRSDIKSGQLLGFGDSKIALEPTEHLDQLSNYISHLHEIRRINEGDDTSASPGYALHLVRIPVSILPGSKTRKGYGAEITVTATPYLGRDLLPTTFRNLVIKDLVDQVSAPILEYFNSQKTREAFIDIRAARIKAVAAYRLALQQQQARNLAAPVAKPLAASSAKPRPTSPPRLAASQPAPRVDGSIRRASADPTTLVPLAPAPTPIDPAESYYDAFAKSIKDSRSGLLSELRELAAKVDNKTTTGVAQGIKVSLSSASGLIPSSRSRNARYAFPGTQFDEVYGIDLINPVAYQAFDAVLSTQVVDSDKPPVASYQRVAGYVQDQVTAAYDFLSRPESAPLWTTFATPELVHAVRSRDVAVLENIRSAFLASLPNAGLEVDRLTIYGPDPNGKQFYTTAAGFSWAILVESVLLNEQLIKDIRESAAAKGEVAVENPLPYFLPCPPDEARESFNAYVRTRFPIHVFALDPFVQEQNIADELARSRELQLALSLAFTTARSTPAA